MTIRMLFRREAFPLLCRSSGETWKRQQQQQSPRTPFALAFPQMKASLFSSIFKGRFSKEIISHFIP